MIRLPFVINAFLCAYVMILELPESLFIGLLVFVSGEQLVLNLFLEHLYAKKIPMRSFFDLVARFILYLIALVWISTIAVYLFARDLIKVYLSVDDLIILILAISALWIVLSKWRERVVSVLLNRGFEYSLERIDWFMVFPTLFAPRALSKIYESMNSDSREM